MANTSDNFPRLSSRSLPTSYAPRPTLVVPREVVRVVQAAEVRRGVIKRMSRGVRAGIAVAVVVVLLISIGAPVLLASWQRQRYQINDATKALLGSASQKLSAKITYDDQQAAYIFNKEGLNASAGTKDPSDPGAVLKQLQAKVGAKDDASKSLYSVDMPTDPTKGITYHDNNLGVSFVLVPQFSESAGKEVNGRVVYPASGGMTAVYTAKNNGLKEDVILNKSPGNELNISYKLQLPKELEARLMDDGSLGVYSADPSLFGNISYGSNTDQSVVTQARVKGAKNNLVFALPAPVIKVTGTKGQGGSSAAFNLKGDLLTVKATGLSQISPSSYPISIDPSVVVTSTADFATGNNEDGNIDFPANQVNRGGVSGGSASGAWSTTNAFSTTRYNHTSVAYNGFLYIIGGTDSGGTSRSDVQYVAINTNGTVGTWATTTALAVGRTLHASVAYNGYLYVIGGTISGGVQNDVQYAVINSNGTIGTWATTTAFTTARSGLQAIAYNDYLYVLGGSGPGTPFNDVQYAPINADGTVGSWTTSTSFTTARATFVATVYNGNMYIAGGYNVTTATTLNDVQYAPISSRGGVGTWVAANSFTTIRSNFSGTVYNGYLYLFGGSGSSADLNDVQYAPIKANGSLGTWATTTSFTTARYGQASVAYNGYIYVMGGSTGGGTPTVLNDVQYNKIDPAGVTSKLAAGSNVIPGLGCDAIGGSIVYNSYVYSVGGNCRNGGPPGSIVSTVYYAQLNADGTMGSWQTNANSLPAALAYTAAVAYNGYIYVTGGYNGSRVATVYYGAIAGNGSVAAFSTGTALPVTRADHSAVAYNGFLYVMGGIDNSNNSLSTIVYASLNATTGAVGTWNTTTALNILGIKEFSATAVNGYLYVVGGEDNSGTRYADVQYITINSNGTLGASWTTTTSFTTARNGHIFTIAKGYAYIYGGETASGFLKDMQYATFNPSTGAIGTWTATTGFSVNRARFAGGYSNGYLYVATGYNGAPNYTNTSEYVQINNGGTGANGSYTATNSFTTARSGHASVAYNGYLYVIGGTNGTNQNDVQYAALNSDGTTGSWATTSSFATARNGLAAVAYNGYLYVIGGTNGTNQSDVQYAPINANGSLGSWATTTSFTTARNGHTSVAYNGYLYVIGGNTGTYQNGVQYAPINTDGTIGSWNSTTAFTTARAGHTSVAYNGYLYVIGGYDGTSYYNDVQYAAINTNGTIGSWTTAANNFVTPRAYHASFVYNGYLYVIGGQHAASDTACTASANVNCTNVQMAPLISTGEVGKWSTVTSLGTARYDHATAAYNGYLYVIGGQHATSDTACNASASVYCSDVLYSPLNVISRTSHYSKLIDLGAYSVVTGITYNGTLPGGTGAISYKLAGTDGVFAGNGTSADDLGNGSACTASGGSWARYVWVNITLDDSQSNGAGVFPDSLGANNANLTDLTVNYITNTHPKTAQRLQRGKYFSSNALQPLDTCGP